MKNDAWHLIRILYYPSSYIDLTHLPDSISSGDVFNDVLINYWILTHFQLESENEYWEPTDIVSSLIVAGWYHLPRAAYLIGGYLLRDRLPRHAAVLMTDPQLLAFISLPLLHHVAHGKMPHATDIYSLGAAFTLSIGSSLPATIKQRILLNFPAGISAPDIHASVTPDNINLLKMAMTYAKNDQSLPPVPVMNRKVLLSTRNNYE